MCAVLSTVAGTLSILNTRQLLLHGMLTALSCQEETTSWLVLNDLVLTAPWPARCIQSRLAQNWATLRGSGVAGDAGQSDQSSGPTLP